MREPTAHSAHSKFPTAFFDADRIFFIDLTLKDSSGRLVSQ